MAARFPRGLLAAGLLAAAGAHGAELQWSGLAPLPESAGAAGAFVSVVDGRLVVAGGRTGVALSDGEGVTSTAWVLDSPEGAWRETTPLPEAVAFGAAASLGSYAVFAGGAGPEGSPYSDKVYRVRFDGNELAYDPLPATPHPVAYASGAALDGVFYLVCGLADAGGAQLSNDFRALDLQAAQPAWSESPPVPGPARHRVATAALDGALYLFGGVPPPSSTDGGGSLEPLVDAYRFMPGTGWKPIAHSPSAMYAGQAVRLGPTHLAVIGGPRAIGRPVPSEQGAAGGEVAAYHAVTDTWVNAGETPPAAAVAGAVAWAGSVVAVALGDPAPTVHAASLAPAPSSFAALDYAALLGYFAVLVLMGLYFVRKGSSTEDFFVAGRRMPWWATGLSIFGTQLSSISFMAVPAKVYATDWVYFLLQMTIVMVAFPVVFFYLPYFRRVKMTSAYEYLESRFNAPVRMYASVSFVLYQLGRMAIVLFLPAIALSTVTGISVYSCILVMGVLSTLYTVMGGMKAVIWTDVVQVFVLYGGALLSLVILLTTLDGGLGEVISAGVEYDKFHMFNWTWDWTTTAVWVVLVGNLFLNLVPYTSDQAVVQRYFTTKDEKAAARSIWTNAILIVPSTLTLFLLGTALWAFYRANPELLNPALPTDSIFPLFIAQHLPAGIAGLLIAAVFAASMSTLDSSLNSVSAAMVTDFYVRFRPESSDARRLLLARVLTGGLGALATATAIALATFDIGSLWDTFQGMMGLLGGGLAGLFALGIFFRGANGRGAMTGAVASVAVLYAVQQHTDLHFFLYGAVGILSCVGIGLVASLAFRDSGDTGI